MVKEIVGDLLQTDAQIIAHQVNFGGVMGGGVAAAIREKLLSRYSYGKYVQVCNQAGRKCLGQVLFLPDRTSSRIIANCFSQDDYPRYDGGLTHIGALQSCVKRLADKAREGGYTVAIPWHYGCGIAGGDWSRVYEVFDRYFGRPDDPTLLIVRREEDF